MFLSRCSNGFYYLWYEDELGRRHKVSTRCKLKSDTLKFLQQFKQADREKKRRLQYVSLSGFFQEYVMYFSSVLRPAITA